VPPNETVEKTNFESKDWDRHRSSLSGSGGAGWTGSN